MAWNGKDKSLENMEESGFELHLGSRIAPGVYWTPKGSKAEDIAPQNPSADVIDNLKVLCQLINLCHPAVDKLWRGGCSRNAKSDLFREYRLNC
jgi:hypothetical protein